MRIPAPTGTFCLLVNAPLNYEFSADLLLACRGNLKQDKKTSGNRQVNRLFTLPGQPHCQTRSNKYKVINPTHRGNGLPIGGSGIEDLSL